MNNEPVRAWPAGNGEMAVRIRQHDWAATALGPPERWPGQLRYAVEMMLASPQIASIVAGPERMFLYNDAAAVHYGDKHPAALGRPLSETWPRAWADVRGHYYQVFAGESVHVPLQPLDLQRSGGEQVFEAFLTPVRDAEGVVIAAHMTGFELGVRLRAKAALRESEERQAFLLKLSDTLRPLDDAVEIQGVSTRLLREHFDAGWCYYAEFEESGTAVQILRDSIREGLPSLVGYHEMRDLPGLLDHLLAGKVMDAPDLPAFPFFNKRVVDRYTAIGMGSFVGTPLVKSGRLIAFMMLADTHKRLWKDEEIGLLTDVAERTWAAVERARAEVARRTAERGYRALFMGTPTPFLLLAPDPTRFTIIDVNDAYLAATMTTREQLVERPLFEVFPDNPADASSTQVTTLRASLERALSSKRTHALSRFKFEIARPDGSFEERWWNPVNTALTNDQGKVVALLHHATDVTDVVRGETALRESETRYRLIVDSARDHAIFTTDTEKRINFWPHGAEAVLGWTEAEALGQPADILFVPEDRANGAPEREFATARNAGVAYDVRWHQAKDGSRAFLDGTVRPLRNDAGNLQGYLKVAQDVTKRRAIEQALAASEARFRQFSDASTSALWIRNATTLRMEFASPAFEAIYGRSCGPPDGDTGLRCWARLVVPEYRKLVFAGFKRIRAGQRVEMEFQIRRASDGELRWVHNIDFPLVDDDGRIGGIAGLGVDITEAKQAVERQGVLVAELQHRTRNLIGVVRSLADRTLDSTASLDDYKERFGRRLSALSRVQGLLSHLAAGERVAFDELLRAELVAHGAVDGTATKVTLDGPSDVPLRSATVQTFALALHELATNAVKYGALSASNPEGRLAVAWHVLATSDDDGPRLYVEWRESGVVMSHVEAPARGGGYGRELIERALPYQLGAKTTYELGNDGVRCTIEVPMASGKMHAE